MIAVTYTFYSQPDADWSAMKDYVSKAVELLNRDEFTKKGRIG